MEACTHLKAARDEALKSGARSRAQASARLGLSAAHIRRLQEYSILRGVQAEHGWLLEIESCRPVRGCVYDRRPHTVTCDIGSLSVGAMASRTIVVVPTAAGVITNNAEVTGNRPPGRDRRWPSSTTQRASLG